MGRYAAKVDLFPPFQETRFVSILPCQDVLGV